MQKTLLFLFFAQLISIGQSQSIFHCAASIERASDDSSTSITLEDMALEVVQPGSNKIVESFPCTPDGNCFALVQDMPQFSLRIVGHNSALFEPKTIQIGGPNGQASCEDLTFVLKGYVCNIPVKMRTAEGELVVGPAGIPIKLTDTKPNGYKNTVNTDAKGIASFEEVPDRKFTAYFDEDLGKTAPDGGKTLYKITNQFFIVRFSSTDGFVMEQKDGFIIESTLVEGFVKQQMSDASPASFIKIVARATSDEEGEVIQTVFTDDNGRYQFDKLKPGKFIVGPETSDTETQQFFKPQNRTITISVGKKTEVAGFQVFGGSISG